MEEGGKPRRSMRGRPQKPTARFSPVLGNSSYAGEWIMTVGKKRGPVREPPPPVQRGNREDTGGSMPLQGLDNVDSLSGEAVGKDAGQSPQAFVETPRFRIVDRRELIKEGEGEQGPRDDMSEEAFARRHKKFELREKRSKRWDWQARKEKSDRERLLRNEAARLMKQERKRQPRKRKGTKTAEPEPGPMLFTHRMADLLAVNVGPEEELPPPLPSHFLEKLPE